MSVQPHRHTGVDSPRIKNDDIDGTMPTGSDEVKLTGDQTVAGVKTFSSIPILPASNPTTDNQVVRKSYADSITPPTATLSVSTDLIDSADNERTIEAGWTNWHLLKQITCNETNGNITVKFDLKDNNGAGGCFGKVYINSVAAGTLREEGSAAWVTYSENFAVSTGDLIQVYGTYDDGGGGTGGLCRNLRLYYQKLLDTVAGTINTD